MKQTIFYFSVIVFWLMLGILTKYITEPAGFGDSDYYFKMAASPSDFVGSPWGYRVAIPYLVNNFASLFAFSTESTFLLAQHAAHALVLFLLYQWLARSLELSRAIAFLSSILFAVSYPTIYYLHNFMHVGLFEYAAIILGIIAIYEKQPLFFFILIIASGFIKETIGLILIPAFFLFSLYEEKKHLAFYGAFIAGMCYFAVFFALRSGLLIFNESNLNSYSSFYDKEYLDQVDESIGGLASIIRQVVTTFGPVLIIAIPGFIAAPTKLKLMVVIPTLATAQVLLATDVSRMISVGLPIIITYCAYTFALIGYKRSATIALITCIYIYGKNKGISEYGDYTALIFFIICNFIVLILLTPIALKQYRQLSSGLSKASAKGLPLNEE